MLIRVLVRDTCSKRHQIQDGLDTGLLSRVFAGSRRRSGDRWSDSVGRLDWSFTERRPHSSEATINSAGALLVRFWVGLDLPGVLREVTNVLKEFVHVLADICQRRVLRFHNHLALIASPRPALERDRERDVDVGPFDGLDAFAMSVFC